jgi:tetratricopeptide (TPR) repeat protein
MARIAEHNALDVVSLARIFLRVERIMAEPERRWATDKVHAPRLASELVAQGREAEGLAILEASGAEGDQASLLLLSRMRRRRREFDAYERAVLALDGESLLGLVERAKLYEHRKRDYGRALECAERAERMLLEGGGEISDGRIPRREEALESLARRLERLRLKLEIAAGDR